MSTQSGVRKRRWFSSAAGLITPRDLAVAVIAIGATLGVTALAASGSANSAASAPVPLDSAAIEWNDVAVSRDGTHSVRHFFRAPTATLDELELHVTTLPAGELSHPAHKHPNEELVIVREGTVEALVNGRLKRVGPGSVIFNAANQMHSLRNVGSGPATYHVINWKSR
jgi:quercetin dioxygenase-like cupin family protein